MDYTEQDCPFCIERNTREIISENDLVYAAFDIYAVSKGHCLIVTKRHVPNFFDTTPAEIEALFSLVKKVKVILDSKFSPSGYNIGININDEAGQTIPHVHVHIIPRYAGDVENPRGGVRNVIPGKGNY
ncbi:HIT family protein [uncultured Draconibacterium sp.]|uniref:HIT family protein n=1 Tax=uncultured Draconibacterium sp. TaxID=1573823 RepID=UPI003217D323